MKIKGRLFKERLLIFSRFSRYNSQTWFLLVINEGTGSCWNNLASEINDFQNEKVMHHTVVEEITYGALLNFIALKACRGFI